MNSDKQTYMINTFSIYRGYISMYLAFYGKVRGVVLPLGTAIRVALWTSSPQPEEVSSLYTFHSYISNSSLSEL